MTTKDYNQEYYIQNKERLQQQKKEYYLNNKDKFRERNKNYNINNKEKVRETNRIQYLMNKDKVREEGFIYRERHPENNLLRSSKNGARERGLDHSITLEDIIIPTHCPYLGVELTNIQGRGKTQTNISIDRIDSSKGYVKGNVQVISWLANSMKQNATTEQLIAFAEGILRIHDRATDTTLPS